MTGSQKGDSRCRNVLAALNGMGPVSPPLVHSRRDLGEGWRGVEVGSVTRPWMFV